MSETDDIAYQDELLERLTAVEEHNSELKCDRSQALAELAQASELVSEYSHRWEEAERRAELAVLDCHGAQEKLMTERARYAILQRERDLLDAILHEAFLELIGTPFRRWRPLDAKMWRDHLKKKVLDSVKNPPQAMGL